MTTLNEIYSNLSITTLASGISPSAVSLTVAAGTGSIFPAPAAGQFFRFTMNDSLTGLVYETIYATGRSGDTFTGLLRGQENTTPVAWVTGDKVYTAPTGGAMANLTQIYQIQSNSFLYSADTGSANAYAIAPNPANLAAPVPGAVLYFLSAHTNTGASTITVNGSSAYPLLGSAQSALQGGEVSGFCAVTYSASLASYVLLWSTGGTEQVANAIATKQAINLGQANALYAAINGNASIPFSASALLSGAMQAPASSALFLETDVYAAAVNRANTAYVQMYVGSPSNAQAAVNLGYAQATYAALNGTLTQNFSANVLLTNAVRNSSNALLLESNQYVAAVNVADNAYVPLYCANPNTGIAAVNLQYAQAAFAALNGSYSQSFAVQNLNMNGNILEQSGGTLGIQSNGGLFVANLANSALTPVTCGGATNANQAVTLGQIQAPYVANNSTSNINTTISISVSFTVAGPGVLLAIGNTNYSQINGNSNNSTLYINGVAASADNTVLTRAAVGSAFTSGGGCSATLVAAASPAFSAWLTMIYVPNL